MPVPTFTGLKPFPEFTDLVNKINTLSQELQNLMLSLDDANFNSITAAVINVQQLSAITADMGKVTAGEIYGALIATTEAGDYPRIEFSSTGNLIDAQGNATDRIRLRPDVSGTPMMIWDEGNSTYIGEVFMSLGTLYMTTLPGAEIAIASSKDLTLQAGSGFFVRVQDWDKVYSNGDSQSLQNALDSKATAGGSTGSAGPYNCGIPIGANVMTTAGNFTWGGVPSHTHTQT